ncbi:MAG: PD40 domain-containing protein [Sedimentisphaerales bacterium]|nr:PD40 domain-containing protein [Sedimentisphaerales bacterium]
MKNHVLACGILFSTLTFVSFAGAAEVKAPDARMLRFPDISAERIVFVYAGDLWTVPRQGGLARKLSSPKGQEMFPKFSPDGQTIAFSGNYDGNTDVYIVDVDGGTPERLTHHSATDLVVEWYPDGKSILYRSRMFSPSNRFNRFFKQPVAGGLPETLPMPYGELATFSPDAKKMVFQFISREFRTWKRYRGGMASDIWLYDFDNKDSKKLTDFAGTDALPMWHENTIYFLSDRDENKKLNIWAYDLESGKTRQVTKFAEYDVKWPSIGPDAIVFENAGRLHLLDLANETSQPVLLQVPADLPRARKRLKSVSGNIENYAVSPSGRRALFEARGEIFTVPEKHGSVRDITNTPGIAERYPAWSPDGKTVAYFSDRTGEYELYTRSGDGKGQEKQITKDGSAFRYSPVWSPDSRKIAFSDKTGSLFIVEIETGTPKFIDKDEWSTMRSYSFSPDSRWLAYAKTMPNRNGAVMIYDSEQQETHQVTGDYYDDRNPVFDIEGDYLFFCSDRDFRPVYGDMDYTWIYPNATEIYAATLRKDVGSPIAPRSDEEYTEKEDKDKKDKADKNDEKAESDDSAEKSDETDPNAAADEDTGKDDKEEKDKDKAEPVKIDFDGFENRIVKMPIDAGNIGSLSCVKGKLVFSRYLPAGTADRGRPSGTLLYYDLKEREEKTVISKISSYDVSADGKKVIYRSNSTYGIIDLAAGKKVGDGEISAGKLKAWIDPHAEWRQIFTEAWRLQRDFFYDPNMHGLDWNAIKERYKVLLDYVVDREDLNYVIGEMIAELNASHTYVRGGDIEYPDSISVGLLGCDFELDEENNAYRISKIYEGAVWDADVRSPLRQPGIEVNEGDYLLAVNGKKVDTSKDPWAAFQGLAGEVVALTISDKPEIEGAREVNVKPDSSEFRLRNLAWIESNRQKVREATNNRVGYVYVPDTSRNGQNELVRQFTPQWNKEALIIDERFNSGGQIPDRFIELLDRPVYNYWARRDHRDWRSPFVAHDGPKVMLTNGWSGSGGDAFPYYFRKAGLGPLVGTRTWGGLIGISGNPQPIDGGYVSVPTFGFWNTEGRWDVEGYGVDPDYPLENEPHKMAQGRDPQLEKAIEVILDLLEKQPPPKLPKPAYPDRSGREK